jgi:hypothetical protein
MTEHLDPREPFSPIPDDPGPIAPACAIGELGDARIPPDLQRLQPEEEWPELWESAAILQFEAGFEIPSSPILGHCYECGEVVQDDSAGEILTGGIDPDTGYSDEVIVCNGCLETRKGERI